MRRSPSPLSGGRQASTTCSCELDLELIGLVPVKRKVEEIGSLLLVDRARQRFGLSASRPNLHMCFTGAPGTGKTTVALMMADLLYRLGYLEKGHLVHAMRDDLVAEYIGQTAPKTKQVLERAMGGVLFIDEAYTPVPRRGLEGLRPGVHRHPHAGDGEPAGQARGDSRRLQRTAWTASSMSNPGMSSRSRAITSTSRDVRRRRTALDRAVDAGPYVLLPVGRSGGGTLRDYLSHTDDSAAVRQRPQCVRNELENARLRHAFRLAADPERRVDQRRPDAPRAVGQSPAFRIGTVALSRGFFVALAGPVRDDVRPAGAPVRAVPPGAVGRGVDEHARSTAPPGTRRTARGRAR